MAWFRIQSQITPSIALPSQHYCSYYCFRNLADCIVTVKVSHEYLLLCADNVTGDHENFSGNEGKNVKPQNRSNNMVKP